MQAQDKNAASARHPIVVVLDRLRSAYNVGNIFRLAEICSIEKIIACGYTPTPPHAKVRKTARGCDKLVQSEHLETSLQAVLTLKKSGYQVVGIETIEGAPDIWDVELRFPVAFVFGNEALGIARETLGHCDLLAKLPVFGTKNSLNVSNCAAVVLYTAIRRLHSP